jgi:hypothetical protein
VPQQGLTIACEERMSAEALAGLVV